MMSTTQSRPKPTIVISPGAFTGRDKFSAMITLLEEHGYAVHFASHPSFEPAEPDTASVASDAQHLRDEVLTPLLDAGADVLVYAHSYGGNVAGAAVRGLSRGSRTQQNLAGALIGLVCCSCPLAPEGQTIEQFLGGLPPSMLRDQPKPGVILNTMSQTRHAARAFSTPVPRAEWADDELRGARVYLRAARDRFLTLEAQDGFVSATGAEWTVRDVAAEHDAHVEMPQVVVGEVERFVSARA